MTQSDAFPSKEVYAVDIPDIPFTVEFEPKRVGSGMQKSSRGTKIGKKIPTGDNSFE